MPTLIRFFWGIAAGWFMSLWLRYLVPQAKEVSQGVLAIPYTINGRLYYHYVSYGLDNMDEYYPWMMTEETNLYVRPDRTAWEKLKT
jgi:hypothetical protein